MRQWTYVLDNHSTHFAADPLPQENVSHRHILNRNFGVHLCSHRHYHLPIDCNPVIEPTGGK